MRFFNKNKKLLYPREVVTTLEDLMRYEFLVNKKNLLPAQPVYSILAGRHASKLRGRGLDFEEVRPYISGDDIRNIDWRVTARTGEAHSKVFNEEKERPTFILLDQSRVMFFGSQRFVKSVSAAHAAAIGAFYTIQRGDRVGGIVFNEENHDYIPPARSRSTVQYYLQCIVSKNELLAERKELRANTALLNEMLHKTRSLVTHDEVILVISDFSFINDETRRHIRGLSNHNDVILIHIYDPLDEQLPDGKMILSNGHQQIRWQNKMHNQGELYQRDFKQMRQDLTAEFRGYRVPVVYFDTAERMEDQIMRAFGRIVPR